MRKSRNARIAAIATGLMLAIAAPATALAHGGGGGGGGGGAHFSGGGSHFSGGHGFVGGDRGFRGDHDFHHGSGFAGGAFLGGLGLDYALDGYPYYDGYGYEDDYGPGQCVTRQRVWDSQSRSYVVRQVPNAC